MREEGFPGLICHITVPLPETEQNLPTHQMFPHFYRDPADKLSVLVRADFRMYEKFVRDSVLLHARTGSEWR